MNQFKDLAKSLRVVCKRLPCLGEESEFGVGRMENPRRSASAALTA